MKQLSYYLKKAHGEHWALGQFNFSDWSQVKGIVAAAEELKAPIILGTSEGESNFVGLQEAVAMRNVLRKKYNLPIFLNLDHGRSAAVVKEAIKAGYDMVCFDGSKLPLQENITISREVVRAARWAGVVVEGEVGHIATDASRVYEGTFQIKEEDLTNVQEAQEYAKKTGVDLLAVSVGTFHGIDANGQSPRVRLDRLQEIAKAVKAPLVLHGGSGTPEEDIAKAIGLGIVKININTETRMAFSGVLRKTLAENPQEIVPYKYLLPAIDAVQEVAAKYLKLFTNQGK
jgi:fructose-bisphosphate aldolase class II